MGTLFRTGTSRPFWLIVAVVTLLVVLTPVAVIAAGGTFTDDDTSIFEADIEWLADHGVTAGCNPPANDHFCPNANVTRGQMAAFLHRFADDQSTDGFSVWHDNALTVTSGTGYDPLLTLENIPAGSYVFIAKTHFQGGASQGAVTCRLAAGGDYDLVSATLQPYFHVPATMTVVHTFTGSGNSVELGCNAGGSPRLNNTKITAIEVNNLTNNPG